jgi:hypothetical protein
VVAGNVQVKLVDAIGMVDANSKDPSGIIYPLTEGLTPAALQAFTVLPQVTIKEWFTT